MKNIVSKPEIKKSGTQNVVYLKYPIFKEIKLKKYKKIIITYKILGAPIPNHIILDRIRSTQNPEFLRNTRSGRIGHWIPEKMHTPNREYAPKHIRINYNL